MAFVIDTFLGWVFRTIATAADAEMNDDTVLRERLLEAEMRREMGEISDREFADIEADLLQRIREIKERREGGAGPLEFGAQAVEKEADETFTIEATLSGDFHEPVETAAPSKDTRTTNKRHRGTEKKLKSFPAGTRHRKNPE